MSKMMNTTSDFQKQFTIEYDDEVDYFLVTWKDKSELIWVGVDDKEDIVDMDNEMIGGSDAMRVDKFNHMWIEYIKSHFKWKKGEVIYLNTKQNADNYFVMRGWGNAFEREEDKLGADYIIDEYGFVCKRFFQNYIWGKKTDVVPSTIYFRIDCIFNDDWCEKKYNM